MVGHKSGVLGGQSFCCWHFLGELMEPVYPFLAPQELEVWMAGTCGRCGSETTILIYSGCWLVVIKEGMGLKAGSLPKTA